MRHNDNKKIDIEQLHHSTALQPVSYGESIFKNAAFYGIGMPVLGYALSRMFGVSAEKARQFVVEELPLAVGIGALVGYVEAQSAKSKSNQA